MDLWNWNYHHMHFVDGKTDSLTGEIETNPSSESRLCILNYCAFCLLWTDAIPLREE